MALSQIVSVAVLHVLSHKSFNVLKLSHRAISPHTQEGLNRNNSGQLGI